MPLSADPPALDHSDHPATAGRLPAALLMAGSCLPILGAVLLAPVMPRMQDHFQAVPGNAALVPLMLTVPALSLALLAPFAGVIVDRLGRKRLLVAATILYALFGTVPLWLDSLYGIVASRVLLGVAEAAIMTCCTTLIGDYYTGRLRDRYLALQTMCASASATVFFVVGGALGTIGWRAPFWLYVVGLLLAPAMAVALPRTAVAAMPPPNAVSRLDRRCSTNSCSRSPHPRMTPVLTIRTPQSRSATPPSSSTMTNVPEFMSSKVLPLEAINRRRKCRERQIRCCSLRAAQQIGPARGSSGWLPCRG